MDNNNISRYGLPIVAVIVTLLINTFIKSRWSTLGQIHFLYNVGLVLVTYLVVEQILKFVFNNFVNKKR